MAIQFKRGTASNRTNYTPSIGELIVIDVSESNPKLYEHLRFSQMSLEEVQSISPIVLYSFQRSATVGPPSLGTSSA